MRDTNMMTPGSKRVLYIDAYDSFTRNIISLVECSLQVEVTSITIDSKWPDGGMVKYIQQFNAIVVGPGPGNPTNPRDVGIINDLWYLSDEDMVPVLGICLGFQSLCYHFGAIVKRLPEPRHGCVADFKHFGGDMFKDLPAFSVTLYHSLQVELQHPVEKCDVGDGLWNRSTTCQELKPLAWFFEKDPNKANNLMAVRHPNKPFWGLQFHPESCMSEENVCIQLIKNWWSLAEKFNSERNIGHRQMSTPTRPFTTPSKPELVVSEMLHLSSTATNSLQYRSIEGCQLSSEMICEIVDIPSIPSVVLESNARYSIISVPSPGSWRLEYFVERRSCHLESQSSSKDIPLNQNVEIWDVLRDFLVEKRVSSGNEDVPFWGGFMGLFSYEVGLEKWGLRNPDHADSDKTCDVSLLWVERSIVIDKQRGRTYIQSTRHSDELPGSWIDLITQRLQYFSRSKSLEDILLAMAPLYPQSINKRNFIHRLRNSDFELANLMVQGVEISQPDEKTYKSRIEQCQEYIRAGESYELCLTDETKVTLPICDEEQDRHFRPWVLYKRLRKYNPASFSAYAKLGDLKIISSSPECFLQWNRKDTLEMKPMKGTVKKSAGVTLKMAQEILRTPKEMGENLMIADLIRHDLFSVCGSGGVTVDKLMEVEDHTRVYQLVTNILGRISHPSRPLSSGVLPEDQGMIGHGCKALNVCLPPGSMTGAPKKRSCELLSRVEDRSRSAYSGVMGYLDVGGGGSFSVLIRTAYSWSPTDGKEGNKETWRIGAGGAITHLSTAEGEWDEMETKLNTVLAIFQPIAGTESGDTHSPEILKEILEKRKQEREQTWDKMRRCRENRTFKNGGCKEPDFLNGKACDAVVQATIHQSSGHGNPSTRMNKRKWAETVNGAP